MGRPLRINYPGAFYHVTSRGNEQKDIYKSNSDRERFLTYLEGSVCRYGAIIHAYCLMTNHYHLLIETKKGNLSEVMHHINGAYTNYFNKKRKRVGHLFQGRFNSILIEADEYLKELSGYIHLNPVRGHLTSTPQGHPWSSYLDYVGQRESPSWLFTGHVLALFDSRDGYRRFVEDMLSKENYQSPLGKTVGSTFLGSESFIEKMLVTHLTGRHIEREVPAIRELTKIRMIETIIDEVDIILSEGLLAKKVAMYLAHRHSGATLKELGSYFGKKESAVSHACSRFVAEIAGDEKLKSAVQILENKLKMS